MDEIFPNQIQLFKSVFKGREDVFAVRWEKENKSGYMPLPLLVFPSRFDIRICTTHAAVRYYHQRLANPNKTYPLVAPIKK
jgi:hypothetical protein